MQLGLNKFYLYLSNDSDLVAEFTGLSVAELDALVGRFDATHDRAGQFKGKFVQWRDGRMAIRAPLHRTSILGH